MESLYNSMKSLLFLSTSKMDALKKMKVFRIHQIKSHQHIQKKQVLINLKNTR